MSQAALLRLVRNSSTARNTFASAPFLISRLTHQLSTSISAAAEESTSSAQTSQDQGSASIKVVVFGGRGFVGSHVCKEALASGLHVVAIGRSGTPPLLDEGWVADVEWVRGDALEPMTYAHHLQGAAAAISCVGAFGSQAEMLKLNGTANVTAIGAAKAAGVPRFVYISATIPKIPGIEMLLGGYVRGKAQAEQALQANYPEGGVALRPGVIYGPRVVSSNLTLPLQYAFQPVEMLLDRLPNAKQLAGLPLVGAAFVPPLSVDVVARAAVRAATDGSVKGGVMDVWEMQSYR